MKRQYVWIWSFLFAISLHAESIPVGYYSAIENLSDSALKSTLHAIVEGGERFQYGTQSYHSTTNRATKDTIINGVFYQKGDTIWRAGDLKALGTWTFFPTTDRNPNGTIWDMYSASVRYFPFKTGESACSIQIEHCMPKSWWGSSDSCIRAYQDLYNLNPADAQANGQKSNFPPGHVVKGDKFTNGSFRMDKAASATQGCVCFEPDVEYRGDFARTYFYMATAYEQVQWVSTKTFNTLLAMTNESYLEFQPWLIQVLLDWHRSDPVSEKEIRRQDAISSLQHNRNPYIDYPDLVEYIWGKHKGQKVQLSSLYCPTDTILPPIIYPTPVDDHRYDTLISMPALTRALVNAMPGGYASTKIQSEGSASINMGSGSTDGYISFTKLSLTDSAKLVFRASPYNTASSMRLDIYADDVLIRTIEETVSNNTRNEVTYTVTPLPATTDSITIISVGGSTSKRACMQELYILVPRKQLPTPITPADRISASTYKRVSNGQVLIINDKQTFDVLGRKK